MNLLQPSSYAGLRSVCKESVLPADALPIRVVTLDGARLLRRLGAFGTSAGVELGVGYRRSSPLAGSLRGCGDPRPRHHSPDWVLELNGRVPVLVGCRADAGTQRGPASVAPFLRGLAGQARPCRVAPQSAVGGKLRAPSVRGRCCKVRAGAGAPTAGSGSQGTAGRLAPTCLSLQRLSSIRKPEPSSCRWAELATRPQSIETVLNAGEPSAEPASPCTPGAVSPGALALPCASSR